MLLGGVFFLLVDVNTLARWTYRVVRLVRQQLWLSMKKALRRGGPLCPPARCDV